MSPALTLSRGRPRNPFASLRGESGAFDLPSIIVGVVVVGILTVGVLASMFGVIPFAQDNGAKQDLASVTTAEGAAKAGVGNYMDKAGLLSVPYIHDAATLAVATNTGKNCWVGVSKSGTGRVFYRTDSSGEAVEMAPATTSDCVDQTTLGNMVTSVGGFSSTATASASPAAGTTTGTASAGTTSAGSAGVQLAGWGGNWDGEQGDGTFNAYATPAAAVDSGALAGKSVTALASSGEYHMCAISSGAPYCWGSNWYGELGNGTLNASASPVAVDMSGAMNGLTTTKLAVADNTCAVASGKAFCWGSGGYGSDSSALGNGSNSDSSVPVAVDMTGVMAGTTVTDIALAGNRNACAVASGKIYCWGDNSYGLLGNGTQGSGTGSKVPVAVDMTAFGGHTAVAVYGGENPGVLCALSDDHKAYCWGSNNYGALGNGTTADSYVPALVSLAGPVTQVSVGPTASCAVSAGQAYCWGGNSNGQLGNGTVDPQYTTSTNPTPAPVTGGAMAGKTVTAISTNADYSVCAVASGAAYCWGDNSSQQLGTASAGSSSYVPVAVDTSGLLSGKSVTGLVSGGAQTLVTYQ